MLSRLMLWFKRDHHWLSLLVFVTVLGVYWATLTPGLAGGDAGELQFVPVILSVTHPTGTPLYILLGKLWTQLPLGGSVAWRMTLLAAVSASMAAILVFRGLLEATDSVVASLVAALMLALSGTFWSQAVVADKYAFNALMVALVFFLALRWGRTRSPATLRLLALAFGLSLTHHRTMVLFAPFLLGYIGLFEGAALWRNWRRLLGLLGLMAAPLLIYLYLPWASARNLPPLDWRPQGLSGWIAYLLDPGFTKRVTLTGIGQGLLDFCHFLVLDFGQVGMGLGVAGIYVLLRKSWRDALLLVASFAIQAVLASGYQVPHREIFYLPSFVIWDLLMGFGLAALWIGVQQAFNRRWVFWSISAVALILAFTFGLPAYGDSWRKLRSSHLGDGVMDIWRQDLKTGYTADRLVAGIEKIDLDSVVVADWEQAAPLWYGQQVLGLYPDVTIVTPMDRLDWAAAQGRPLVVARTVPNLTDYGIPNCDGPLIEVLSEPLTIVPDDVSSLQISFGDIIQLAGYRLDAVDGGLWGDDAEGVLPITLYWETLRQPESDYAVSLRLVAADGSEVTRTDSTHPVLGTYPTSLWRVGQVVGDYYELQVPADTVPGTYTLQAVLYETLPEGAWRNLDVSGDSVVWLIVQIGE